MCKHFLRHPGVCSELSVYDVVHYSVHTYIPWYNTIVYILYNTYLGTILRPCFGAYIKKEIPLSTLSLFVKPNQQTVLEDNSPPDRLQS